jgi:Fe-S oxidoreductase
MSKAEGIMEEETITIDDALWDELIELTDGTAALCYQCGVCTASCPWGLVREEALSVRTFMRQAQLGTRDGSESLWLCTTCAQCEAYCPRGVNIADVFRSLRTIAWEQRTILPGLPSLMWSVYWNNNPWSQPPSQRSDWAKDLDIPFFDPGEHEILFYVGCTSSFDSRAQKVAKALVEVLRAAGVAFGYLGEDEPCCGEAALSVGHKYYFREIAENTARVFHERGVGELVTVSPHCYDVFANHYPSVDELIQPMHYTQYLARLVDEGRLVFPSVAQLQGNSTGSGVMVTFQDPCYLGRHNDEYEAPRRLLDVIPGITLVEMDHNRVDGLCCGGGGGRMWLETEPGERFSDLRANDAQVVGAEILLTACPFCLVCLDDSVKAMKLDGMQVMDVAEIAALAMMKG